MAMTNIQVLAQMRVPQPLEPLEPPDDVGRGRRHRQPVLPDHVVLLNRAKGQGAKHRGYVINMVYGKNYIMSTTIVVPRSFNPR